MHSERPDLVGIPKYLGLSLFGMPPRDIRKEGQELPDIDFQGTLKEHQEQCTTLCLNQIESYSGATLIADCGVGKTAMAIYILSQIGRKTAIVCNRSLLIDQWYSAIRKFSGPDVTISKLEGTTVFDKTS
jgi:superfamily II DNA or RNA helicase